MILDRRVGIGPHHLSIGKTRKVFDRTLAVQAYYSIGNAICHAIIDDKGRALTEELELPVAWGGLSFTVDAGRILFVHADGQTLCLSEDRKTYKTVFKMEGQLSAPWLCGEQWSVVERGNGVWVNGGPYKNLHPSCVQLFDVGVAIGFGGDFPTKTELRWKQGGTDWRPLVTCNVNDRTTFHFGATERDGEIFLAYLDDDLTVTLGRHKDGFWYFRHVIPIACFAPNVSFVNGELNVFACDYYGTIWRWREGYPLERLPIEGPEISPLYAMTGYGTGGMLIPPEIHGDRIPVLISHVRDDESTLVLEFAPLRATNEAMCTDPSLIPSTFKRII